MVRHCAILAAIILIGLALRFWQLDSKPLWLDEVLTALFTMGRRYEDVPLNTFFSLTALDRLFTFQPGANCSQIAQTVATESVHPPLFFCLLYSWMDWLRPDADHWVWALRALPAFFGVGTIAALYCLNRFAFSPAAGLMGSALMAVSPFAVYLSQEARHYTLPMLLITLALTGLVQIQHDLSSSKLRPIVWLGWSIVNVIGLYTHYFCILALIAQLVALLGWIIWRRQSISRYGWGAIAFALGGITLSYLPWIPTLLNHVSRPETDWLIPYKPDWRDRLEPLYQTLVNWVLMVIAIPVENQPISIMILGALGAIAFTLWLIWRVSIGFRHLWHDRSNRPSMVLLTGFTLCVVVQFFAIVYFLDKDITVVPRYNFVYYPSVCALLSASLVQQGSHQREQNRKTGSSIHHSAFIQPLTRTQTIVLLAGLSSSMIVIHGLAFQKSYYPDRVAQTLAFEPDKPLITVVSYRSLQEVALGLSFALELKKLYPSTTVDDRVRYGFVDRSSSYMKVWQGIPNLTQPFLPPINLWIFASPGMRTKDYAQRLKLFDPSSSKQRRRLSCDIDPDQFHRLGFPYQLFRCLPKNDRSKPSESPKE
ncbi:MAG: hypothetical protein HC769_09080 [Cyanobacteria bacterium CRU_2_1]|nr:hypothetical protein [Cyanobacteria bacterium RU_5_0]NJR58987.1 hypothetical protein [Cyanobacteria bacterium CRU_2_1]